MAVTLMQAAIRGGGLSKGEIATISYFDRTSRVLEDLPFKKIDGKADPYNIEAALPGVAWRDVNESYTESSGVILPKVEQLHILGGDVFIDNFLYKTEPKGSPSLRQQEFSMKAKALAIEFDRAFFEGDDLVSDKEMVGLRRRLTGTQVMLAGTGGATMTLAMLDQLLDLVPFDNKIVYMNRSLRRKVTSLVNAAGGSARISYTQDTYGRQNTMYGDTPIRIIESMGDASTILDFDEDPGDGTADTSSVYVVAPGLDRVHGIYNGNAKLVDVHLVSEEMETKPGLLGRIEGYYGIEIPHPRAAARLRGVTNT